MAAENLHLQQQAARPEAALQGRLHLPGRWAAHFAYEWVRKDDVRIDTDLVDLFEFSETSGLIKSLKIIFDR